MSCIFCQIVNGELPSHKVYEDDQVLAFLDIAPVSRGHILVIPKEHTESLLTMTAEQTAVLFSVAQKIAKAIEQALDPQGINLGMNNGFGAGQIVAHAHIHIIPRFAGDGLKLWSGRDGLYKEDEAEGIAKKIRSLI